MIKNKSKFDLAVCILFFEKVDQTIECVSSFWRPEIKIYILNNNSSAQSRNRLGEYCKRYPNVTIFDSAENLGVSGGRNFLISHTNELWLLFVDNDIVCKTKHWLEKIEQHIETNPGIEIFIPKLYNALEKKYSIYTGFHIEGKKVVRNLNIFKSGINSFPGGASFISRNVFDRIGLYDEALFVGFEDFELAFGALLDGKPVVAKKIKDITFDHDHRVAHSDEDKKAILARYDHKMHDASITHISQKHGLIFDEEYEDWLNRQKDLLVGRKEYKKKVSDYFLVRAFIFVARRIKKK